MCTIVSRLFRQCDPINQKLLNSNTLELSGIFVRKMWGKILVIILRPRETWIVFIHVLHIILISKISCCFITALGAAYGTAKSGTGIAAMSVMRPELIMKSIIPVVMAGIIAIYGLVVAVLIAGQLDLPANYTLYKWVMISLTQTKEKLM